MKTAWADAEFSRMSTDPGASPSPVDVAGSSAVRSGSPSPLMSFARIVIGGSGAL